ncbi:sugar-binding transcriptional regulator [Streptomyces sp. NEAU-W12]|uniref:sugar-binding transcriptional regulator n=1 Tax=Streptomyces sp. NEAU-W12 TaxID=2994668 RepID=UPI00224B07D9|nr:sugar-binding domain-containing protein [Streptomyces sp. NEAU-W12]MCX2923474.1 transcriptional regulator [Streptomyces sp. NEAU-W12]
MLLAAIIAKRFYLENASKVDIGQEMGLSRFKVARLLDTAVARGLVRIDITFPTTIDVELSDSLARRYGLKHAIVVDPHQEDPGGPEPFTELLAFPAARLVMDLLHEEDTLGLAWGRAVTAVSRALTRLPPCSVVQLTGVDPRRPITDKSVEAVGLAASLSGSAAHPLYAPLVLPNALTAAVLCSQPTIAQTLDRFDTLTTAVLAVGAWGPGLSTVHDALSEAEQRHHADMGVVAEMASLLFDADGTLVSSGIGDRVIAVNADQLRRTPEIIAVVGGRAKARAVRAVLRSGLLTGIVTDAATARTALASGAAQPGPSRQADARTLSGLSRQTR